MRWFQTVVGALIVSAIASTFWVGVAGAVIAAVCMLFLREGRMRATFEMEPAAPAAG